MKLIWYHSIWALKFKPSSKIFLLTFQRWCFFCGSFMLFLSCFCYVFVRICLLMPCGHLLGKGWPLGSRLWCLIVKLSLFHWYLGPGVVLDCLDPWSLPSFYFNCAFVTFPCGILGQVWYLIVMIPDLCRLSYFYFGQDGHFVIRGMFEMTNFLSFISKSTWGTIKPIHACLGLLKVHTTVYTCTCSTKCKT